VLFLFDVDGTLVRGATDAHVKALLVALHEVHGVRAADVRAVGPAGRTDGEIARQLLLEAGISAARIGERADDVRAACCEAYAQLVPDDLSEFVIPGVPALLERLTALAETRLALVTGNYEPIARLKLSRAGLGRWFPVGLGAFGSDSEDRAALPGLARRRAGADGVPHPRSETVVIGDTPRDIACARADGVRCIAVATGPFGVDELSGADGVAADTAALEALLRGAVERKDVHDQTGC
jgi:phosphoglycolate phosphatase-like HAD superfamily hydrolase